MRFPAVLFGIIVLTLLSGSAAAQTCAFTAQTSALPGLSGRVVYTDKDTGLMHMYDFQSGMAVTIPSAVQQYGSADHAITNPVFSPDGKAVLFSGVSGDNRDLYYWVLSTGTVTKLTGPFDSTMVHEDGKFSPDGKRIVWKRYGNIVVGDFNPAAAQMLTNMTALTTDGVLGMPTEASGPVFSPTQKYVYYFIGNMGHVKQLRRYTFSNNDISPAFPQNATLTYYYPADPDLYDFLYTRWNNATDQLDGIYQYTRITLTSTLWNPTDCAANNSDPAPVDETYFLYSRDHNPENNGGRYELYLGHISAGIAWRLPTAANGTSGQLVGANYTGAR